MKKIICVLVAFFLVFTGTVALDILKEDKECFSESPFRQFYADPANEGRILTYDDLFFVTSLDEPVYTVGSSGISKEQMAAMQARDAEMGNNTAEMHAHLYTYSKAEIIAFQKLLQKLTFRPVEGMKNVLLSRLSNHRNSIAVFQLSNRYYSGNMEPYQDILGMVPENTASIVGQTDRVESGLIFSWQGHVYLDAYLVPRSEYQEKMKMEVPAVWDEYQAVFEILPAEALDELLAQRQLYASGIDEAETGMHPLLRRTLIREAWIFSVLLLIALLYEIVQKKKRRNQSKRVV